MEQGPCLCTKILKTVQVTAPTQSHLDKANSLTNKNHHDTFSQNEKNIIFNLILTEMLKLTKVCTRRPKRRHHLGILLHFKIDYKGIKSEQYILA